MKAGKDKITVLNDMGERCGVQDVSSFVTVLVQSAAFGTSISDALRVYAAEMRDKRVMRAEEAANKLPTKMTLATMGLTVPPLLIILVGPSVHGITQLGNMGGLDGIMTPPRGRGICRARSEPLGLAACSPGGFSASRTRQVYAPGVNRAQRLSTGRSGSPPDRGGPV